MIESNRPFAFERSSNILSFSRNTLPIKNNSTHIYIPWTTEFDKELMFKVKKQISSNGGCLIPFCDLNMNSTQLDFNHLESIQKQISDNIETHLVMSNGDSIHIFNLKRIHIGKLTSSLKKSTLECFDRSTLDNIWFEVDDVYVYRANHDGVSSVNIELEKLICSEQKGHFFTPIQKINIENEIKQESTNWVQAQRNLTYDYFVRSCELEENIFQDSWRDLNARSRHCLISFEQLRHKALLHKDLEKVELLKESFELYLSALLNELNEVYISPLAHAFENYSCLQEAWGEIREGLVNPQLRSILEKTYNREDKQLTSLEDFLFYTDTIKSCLFSLKNRFSRKIGKEEFLIVETFLTKQENMIESLLSRGLNEKIKFLVIVKDWLCSLFEDIANLENSELKSSTLKLTHILSIISSTNYDDNILFKILEEKTARGFVKRSFEDEVKSLNIKNKKMAS